MIIGTAIIIFVFRAIPSGAMPCGLKLTIIFDEQFLSVLSLIASIDTARHILLRPFARNSMAKIIVILSIAGAVLFLPSIGMYAGYHWTPALTSGVVDADSLPSSIRR